MRSVVLFCAAAALATAVAAAPNPGGGLFGPGGTPYDGYPHKPDDQPHKPDDHPYKPDDHPHKPNVHHGDNCLSGPEVHDGEWKHARKGNHRDGEEHASRPPLRSAAGLQIVVESVGDGIQGEFAHHGCRNGATLKKLEVWGHDGVNGVRLTYHDGEQFAAGKPDGCYNAHAFKRHERLKILRQTGDGKHITFETSDGKFAFGMRFGEGEAQEASVHHDVHSGFICGVSGNDVGGLGSLVFHFAPKANFVSLVIDRSSFTPEQLTVTDHTPVLNNINIEYEPKLASQSLHTRAYTYKSDSNLGYWVETVVHVKPPLASDHGAETAAPFDVEFSTFKGTREFALEAPEETLKFEIPPRSECTVRVAERVANAFVVRWTGSETYFMDDGTSFSMKIGGTLRGYDVIDRSVDTDCFPIGLVHSWHKYHHDWEDRCVGAKCKKSKDCCGDLECITGRCQSGVLFPPVEPPLEMLHVEHVHTYLRQCAGSKCKANSDCCGDLECNPSTSKCESPYLLHRLEVELTSHPKPEWWEADDHHAGDHHAGDHHADVDMMCCGPEGHNTDDGPPKPKCCGHAEDDGAEEKCCVAKDSHPKDDYAKPNEGSHDDEPACCDVEDEPGKSKCCDAKEESAKPKCCGAKYKQKVSKKQKSCKTKGSYRKAKGAEIESSYSEVETSYAEEDSYIEGEGSDGGIIHCECPNCWDHK